MRTALVAVAGQTPQILTETLYALLLQGEVPSEIHVLTTTVGRLKVREKLLDPHDGAFYRFCRDFGIEPGAITFNEGHVHVLGEDEGRPIDDIRTDDENSLMADHICSFVRALCERPEIRVHASLAGGRKTMTFYLGYALSLFGRDVDSLSHVLVSPDFESHDQFFYPPPDPVTLTTRAGKQVRTDAARVDLVDIPFLRLREHVRADTLARGFQAAVAEAQARLAAAGELPEVHVWLEEHTVECGGLACVLPPQPFALWLHLLLTALFRNGGDDATGQHYLEFEDLMAPELFEELSREAYERLKLNVDGALGPLTETRALQEVESLRPILSKVNSALKRTFELRRGLYDTLKIQSAGRNPTLYGLRVPADRVTLRRRKDPR